MQESCPCGSVRGASGNRRPYRDTTEGEKEWLSGFYATPNEALGFFEFLVGI